MHYEIVTKTHSFHRSLSIPIHFSRHGVYVCVYFKLFVLFVLNAFYEYDLWEFHNGVTWRNAKSFACGLCCVCVPACRACVARVTTVSWARWFQRWAGLQARRRVVAVILLLSITRHHITPKCRPPTHWRSTRATCRHRPALSGQTRSSASTTPTTITYP